jgi:hypothetical protein
MPGDYTNGLVLVGRLGKSRRVVQGAPQGLHDEPGVRKEFVTGIDASIQDCARVVDEMNPGKTIGPPVP